MNALAAMPLRTRLWLVGVILCMSFYGARSSHPPRKSTVGIEQRLFAGTQYTPIEHPGSHSWFVGVPLDLPWQLLFQASPFDHFRSWLFRLEWPAGGHAARKLTPFQTEGTWSLEPLGIRRVWRYQAVEITGQRYLAERHVYSWMVGDNPKVLDLHTRRTLSGQDVLGHARDLETEESTDQEEYVGDEDLFNAESISLEGLGNCSDTGLETRFQRRRVALWIGHSNSPQEALYAVSDETTPKVLRLTHHAKPVALSTDCRILFFERDGALWRLDFHRPLTELVSEVVSPPLPDPPP